MDLAFSYIDQWIMDKSPVCLDRPGVEVGVEEDDGVGEDEDGVGRAEAGHEHLVARDVPPREHLNHLLHLLGLAWEGDFGMSLAQGDVQVQPGEVHALVHEAVQDGEVERPPKVGQVIANLREKQYL